MIIQIQKKLYKKGDQVLVAKDKFDEAVTKINDAAKSSVALIETNIAKSFDSAAQNGEKLPPEIKGRHDSLLIT